MEDTCVPYTELPHSSKLFEDFLYHPARVRPFYSYLPHDTASYRAAAQAIDFPAERRAALVSALRSRNENQPALDKLAQPGTVAVVTGQQVGLFSGPAYTIHKALTAVRLARQLTDDGIPAVPVFWLATEDHDFAEVNHAWVFDAEHKPAELKLAGSSASSAPVGGIELVAPPVAELRNLLQRFPFGDEVSVLVEECYTPGKSLGQAFGDLLRRLLSDYDLLHLDPLSPEIRKLAAPGIRSALASAPELTRLVIERNKALTVSGYHAQVHFEDHTSFVFLLENGRRLTLRRHGSDYVLNGRRFSTSELADRAEQLSPNALLRPVVQDSILPTVAYVGGPAELAYLAQSQVIYREILGRSPVPVHRRGFTLLDQRSHKLIERYGLTLQDFFHGETILREHIAARLAPPALAAIVEETETAVNRAVGHLEAGLNRFDPSLAKAMEKSRQKIAYQVSKIDRKIGREMLRRDERAQWDAGYLYGLIYPNRHLQERLYCILPFLARHGIGLIGQLYESVRLECPDHQLLVV